MPWKIVLSDDLSKLQEQLNALEWLLKQDINEKDREIFEASKLEINKKIDELKNSTENLKCAKCAKKM